MLGWGQLLVTPYVLAGMVFGYLVAYWYLLPSTWGDESENPNWKRISRALGTLFALSLIGGLAVTPFVNFRFADGRGSSFLSTYAREVIKSMSGRTWLVTDGAFDAQLMIAANDLHCRVRVLNANAGSQDVYMKYVADQFDSPRLKNLARIGMFPLLQEWLKTTPEAISDVAVLSTPDIWVGSGFSALPNRLVFLGAKNLQETDPEKVFLEHERFWKEAAPVILSKASRAALLEYSKQRVVRHMGLVANNLGVFMEDMQRKDEAFKAYSKAREIDAGNISALLNQITMIENGYPTSSAETIKGELKKILAGRNARLSIWSLSLDYGYVRSPQAFVQLGWVWALSGQPGLAVSGLKRAMDLLPENKKSMLKQTLAGIRLSQDEDEESETLYKELLMENPENVTALVGLTRIASKKGDQQHAQELLLKAKQAGLSEERLALEQASLYVRAGDLKQARSLLQERVGSKPRSDAVGTMLLGILIRQNDERTLQEYLDKMEAVEGKDGAFVLALARGHLAVKQNDWNAARSHFEQAIARNPDNVYILESLLRLDVMLMKADQADADVKKLLRADPDNAFGNYILGTLQLKDKNYGLAEDAFRKSLQKNKTPLVLNDLAWLLQERGSYEEAEKLARAAIDAYDKTFQPWDTLGVILMRTRRLDEAEQAFQKALSFFDGDFNLFLHMAELYVMKKNKGRASELIQTITDKKIRLSLEDQSKLEGIRRLAEEL
jgi:Tfp pilus assembly protein PilF